MKAPDWAWVGLFCNIMAYWTIYDYVLAPRYGWATMSGEMRRLLHETVAGPLIFGLLVAIPAIFLYHIFQAFLRYR